MTAPQKTGCQSRPPIAVLGVGCRFPLADDVGKFWDLLCAEVDAICEVPPGRWSLESIVRENPGLCGIEHCRWGGFIDDGDCFDAEFFGIGAEEAERMDPQQGMVLEAAWQALEHGAIAPDSLRGSSTGVFVGVSTSDFDRRLCSNLLNLDLRAGTGTSYSIVANRLSYVLGSSGPSIVVDLACSSSLTAIHLACQSLWLGDCELALAGGVHLILSPEKSVTFAQGNTLARDGRCRTFSSNANGYVRGEGCGMVVLKSLVAAERDGDPVFAIIRGSAVNHNGQSNGLSAPAGVAQRLLVERALAVGGVEPNSIDYVEAHGTGTLLGDVIEVAALKSVLSVRRESHQRCLIGSVKPNIGHLEAAAGIASLIKAILSVREAWIPKTLSATPLNPGLRLESSAFGIVEQSQRWPTSSRPRRAGVSSFSFGGANAHIIVEQPPERESSPRVTQPCLLALSARSEAELLRLAEKYSQYFATMAESDEAMERFADSCHTAAVGRKHFPHRLALVAQDPVEARRLLEGLVQEEAPVSLTLGTAGPHRNIVLVYAFAGSKDVDAVTAEDGSRQVMAAISSLGRCGINADGVLGIDRWGQHVAQQLRARATEDPKVPDFLECEGALGRLVATGGGNPPSRSRYDTAAILLIGFGDVPAHVVKCASQSKLVRVARIDARAIAEVVGAAYVFGFKVDWRGLAADHRRLGGLPTYPFQRRRYWKDGTSRLAI